MAHFPHLHLRGSTWWWRRAFTVRAGEQILVALSLRTRDPKQAQRFCRRANVIADELMEQQASPTAANLKAAIVSALFQARLDTDARIRHDLREAAALDGEKQRGALGMSALAARRHSYLFGVAAAFGPITRFTDSVHEYLKAQGVSWMDADWVASKIEKGYTADMFASAGIMTGTPPQDHFARRLEEDGCEATAPAVSEAYRTHAAARAAQERSAAEAYTLAKTDLKQAFGRLTPEPPFNQMRDPAWPAPPWAGMDEICFDNIDTATLQRQSADDAWGRTAVQAIVPREVREAVGMDHGGPSPVQDAAIRAPVSCVIEIPSCIGQRPVDPFRSQAGPAAVQKAVAMTTPLPATASDVTDRAVDIGNSYPETQPVNAPLTRPPQGGTRASVGLHATYTLGGYLWRAPVQYPTSLPIDDAKTEPETPASQLSGVVATSVTALATGDLGRVPAGATRPPAFRPPDRHGVAKPMAVVTPLMRITTIPEAVEAVIQRKTKDATRTKGKGAKRGWDAKTAKQVRGVGQLFAAVVGSYELKDVRAEHVPMYFRTLEALHKGTGLSSRAHLKSLEEHLASSAERDEGELGRDAGTVNRHVSQLGTVLANAKPYGLVIHDWESTLENERVPEDDPSKLPFTCEDITGLLQHDIFINTLSKCAPSLYWVTLLAIYTGARMAELCGLRVADIDGEVVLIQKNQHRRLKNKGATRRIPLHPELVRLGFLRYVAAIRAMGSDLLFPDLRERGALTSLANLFAKQFVKILDEALPHARKEQGKTFHSFRHFFNSYLIGKVDPSIRYRLMGHTTDDDGDRLDVNILVYGHHDNESLLSAISLLPKLMKDLKPRVWS